MFQKFILYISHLIKSELFNFNRTEVYSRSNRVLDIKEKQTIICLYNKNNQKIGNLKKVKEHESVDAEMDNLSKGLCVDLLKLEG